MKTLVKKTLKNINIGDYALVVLGTAITSSTFGLIILPLNFASAGVTGLSRLVSLVIDAPLYQIVLALNIFLFVLGTAFFGKAFAGKTFLAAFLFPYMLKFFQTFAFLNADFRYPVPMAIVAGVLLGIGAGMIIRGHASSGGLDVIALILHKYLPISVGLLVNIIDVAVMAGQAVNLPVLNTVCGIIVSILCAPVMNFVIGYTRREKVVANRPAANSSVANTSSASTSISNTSGNTAMKKAPANA